MKKKFASGLGLSVLAIVVLGAGCNNLPTTPGVCTDCSDITPDSFVAALVQLAQSGQIPAAYANSSLAKAVSLQQGYFIIWDGFTQSYEAVNISGVPTSANCAEKGATCSNLNPSAAAQAFANATGENHTTTVSSPKGAVTIVNGTQFGGSFGSYNYIEPGTGPGTSSELWWMTGSPNLNYFPVTPDNSVTAPTGGQVYQDGFNDNLLYGQSAQTKDVDLQRAQLQNTSLLARAAQISSGLQMDFKSAIQLTQLADRIQAVQASQNALTDADRAAISQNLLHIAGVSQDEVNQAVRGALGGNMSQTHALLDKISQNLGMPQATLRDQILPKLGVNLN